MTETEVRIAKRLVREMRRVAALKVDMQFFQGLGMSLAIVFEECTGKSARNTKPIEIMQWADSLSEPERVRRS